MPEVQEQSVDVNSENEKIKLATKKALSSEVEIDIPKLHSLPSEQQDIYLFTFVTNFEKHTKSLTGDGLKTQQARLKKELLKIISLQYPLPNRIVRNTVSRCFTHIFAQGDRRPLFESITELVDLLVLGKGDKETRNKHAAVHCLGEIYKVAGDGAINLSGLTCAAILRLLKSATNHVGLRSAIFRALGKIVASVAASLEESTARDIFKQAKSVASNDRGAPAQMSACWCLRKLVKSTGHFMNTLDFDALKVAMWKAGESPVPAVRNATAVCLASILTKAYTDTQSASSLPKTPRLKKPKKPTSGQSILVADSEDSDTARLASPTWKKGSIRLEMTLPEMFQQLSSQYVRSSTTKRGRAAIVCCYVKVLRNLAPSIVESQFGIIAEHLFVEILSSPSIAHHRYRLLLSRRFVQKILADIVCSKILSEVAQIDAARLLINDFLKNYPRVLKEKAEPSKNTLTGALTVLGSLIKSLGSAFSSLVDSCRDGLIQVLQHPSYTVQIHASHCLRLFVSACPQQLIPCASICMNSVNRELGLLDTGRHTARTCLGYANGLAAVLDVSKLHPLYSSIEISSQVFQAATSLLKSSANTELRVSGTQVQVAWTLIGGLMSLGPNFVKIHLSQLLLLWRNALPRALTKENFGQKQVAETSFLLLVRESALGSILSFLEFNSRLLTSDVSKRIAFMLQNTVDFLDDLPVSRSDDELSPRITPSLQLPELLQMVRRRVLQCFNRLAICSPQTSKEVLSDTTLLSFAVSCFAEPESYNQGSLGSSIAQSASNFESIWSLTDNYAFGTSGFMHGLQIEGFPGEKTKAEASQWYQDLDLDEGLESILSSPICGAREHDFLCIQMCANSDTEYLPDPPATEVVNSAIVLFALALPLQDVKIQESMLEQLHSFLSAKSLTRDPGRKAAITVNISLAILNMIKVGRSEISAAPGELRSPVVERCLDDLLRTLVTDPDQRIRHAASEALGRLCNGSGSTFTTSVVQGLVDTIVTNRDPNTRAGCAMALGSIHSNVGGMAAGFHLRKIHGILMSLCSDPHPTVHFWAIEALSLVAESAGLTFSGYLPSTLGLLTQLWLSDTHGVEADSIGTVNAEMLLPSPGAIAHTLASLINVLGPDLQDMSKVRDLIITLVRQFDVDDLPLVQGQALQCWQHIYLYAPAHVNLTKYVSQLQVGLESNETSIFQGAVDGLYALIRLDAEHTFDVASGGIDDQIWHSLNNPFSKSSVQSIVQIWLNQTSLTQTARWISRCQEILTKTVARNNSGPSELDTKAQASAAPDLQDEEVAGFALDNTKDEGSGTPVAGQELLKWQIRAFALQCLFDVLTAAARDIQYDPGSLAGLTVQHRVSEIIRMAFVASTSSIVELRISGLKLIDQVLKMFGGTPDPDFAEALLLEQFQAQISSALAPAFGADSSPELASTAINVCATFIVTGLVTDVERMGRILKLLVNALGSFLEPGELSLGDLKGLSSNAQAMVRTSVLSAWAKLQVASGAQPYLLRVMEPHIATLTPLWLSSLQEFARLKFEPDISSTLGTSVDDSLDTMYAALNRQTLLKFYQASWLKLIDAIASLIDQDIDSVLDALDKRNSAVVNSNGARGHDVDYHNEPVAFFFVLYGLAIEALTTQASAGSADNRDQKLDILMALKKILRPSISGKAIYQDVVFSETVDLFDRLVLTEEFPIQGVVVDIARNLCLSHPSIDAAYESEEHLSDDIEQLFELARIIVLVLAGALPNLTESPTTVKRYLSNDAVRLIVQAMEALVDVSDVFPSIIQADLHACILQVFTTILGTGVCQESVVPTILPVFKRFIQSITRSREEDPALAQQYRSCLLRFRSILTNAQRRESDASLFCARNILMSSIILLTASSRGIAPNDPLTDSLLADILDCLSDRGLGKVAAGCARTLLLASSDTDTAEAIARFLLPRLLYFVINESQEDLDNARGVVLHALNSFVSAQEGEEASIALCVIVPLLLRNAKIEGKGTYSEIATRLLSLASVNQAAFREVIMKMDDVERSFVEEVLRKAHTSRDEKDSDGYDHGGEPSIALKLSFGEA